MAAFRDRRDAGRQLAERLTLLELADPVVLALPRGGVPVAMEVASLLGAPLDVFVARKLGAPWQPELAVGAIAEGSDDVVAAPHAAQVGFGPADLAALAVREREELARRVRRYRGDRQLPGLAGRDVVLVDDGLATGTTAEAALRALRRFGPRRLVLAVPVAAPDAAERLRGVADDVVSLISPSNLGAVGAAYDDFTQTTDDEVTAALS